MRERGREGGSGFTGRLVGSALSANIRPRTGRGGIGLHDEGPTGPSGPPEDALEMGRPSELILVCHRP